MNFNSKGQSLNQISALLPFGYRVEGLNNEAPNKPLQAMKILRMDAASGLPREPNADEVALIVDATQMTQA